MHDNWYEAVVSSLLCQVPYCILSIVDWASNAPALSEHPIPSEPAQHLPVTYNIFAWGINDPLEGNYFISKENFDSLVSPLTLRLSWNSLATIRIILHPCLDWSKNTHVGVLISHAFDLCLMSHCLHSSTLDSCPLPPPQPPAQDTCK